MASRQEQPEGPALATGTPVAGGFVVQPEEPPAPAFAAFLRIWAGQLVSILGSRLTAFALGVWVYQRTGSVTQFALISLYTALPSLVLSPLAGVLADRMDRRRVMILSDTLAAAATASLALLMFAGRLEVWHIHVSVMVGAIASTFQVPAYTAATTQLVPREQLGRASGMVQLSQSLGRLAAPPVAGLLLVAVGIQGVILVDFATFLIALVTLLSARIPPLGRMPSTSTARGSLWRDAFEGWHYVAARPGLMGMLVYFALINLCAAFTEVLAQPIVLSLASPAALGITLTIAGSGMLGGSLLMSVWGGPRRGRMYVVLGSGAMLGVSLVFAGARPSLVFIQLAAFSFMFWAAVANASSQALWQAKVEPAVQGRVFAIRLLLATSPTPLAYAVAGPLVDRVFEPRMAPGGGWSTSLGAWIGVGTGRGSAALLVIEGALVLAATLLALLHPRIRRLEEELPDARPRQ
ncbi:MFS transporter [Myxococcus faecalis]|uniref:MFS transporter n=1 Tax=Myxococcus faecalis TaxID=3115646 RepID=UPI0038CFAD02